MKTFKASRWDSDVEDDDACKEMFKERSSKKKYRSLKPIDEEKNQKALKKMLRKGLKDLKSNDVNFITVQTKIALGNNRQVSSDTSTGDYKSFTGEKTSRKKCKKSKAEMTSDSDDSQGVVTKKQKKMMKKYSSEINTLNVDSGKLSKEYLKEKKRQKRLKKKLEKAAKKQDALNRVIATAMDKKEFDLKRVKIEPPDDTIPPNPGTATGIFRNIKIKQEGQKEKPNGQGGASKTIQRTIINGNISAPRSLKRAITTSDINATKPLKRTVISTSINVPRPLKRTVITRPEVGVPKPLKRTVINTNVNGQKSLTRTITNSDAGVSKPVKRTVPNTDIDIPKSLKLLKEIQLREKLKLLLDQVEKAKPKPILTLKQKMMEKLKAARFRFLNEQIYTTDSKEAQRIFKSDPEAFLAYHEGYRQQVKSWPVNPLHVIIKAVMRMPKSYIVADFGCGEAKLAKCVEQKVHSFDLVAVNDHIVACDMANVPLPDASVDVAVFCLSLMGTNLRDYLFEANRVLKVGGTLKIAEVESRFDNVDNFIEGVQHFGFKKIWKDLSNNLFYFMDFKKVATVKNKKKLPTISLLPCLYKKR